MPTAQEIVKYVWTDPKNEEKPNHGFRFLFAISSGVYAVE